jgi:hypothetical protein
MGDRDAGAPAQARGQVPPQLRGQPARQGGDDAPVGGEETEGDVGRREGVGIADFLNRPPRAA